MNTKTTSMTFGLLKPVEEKKVVMSLPVQLSTNAARTEQFMRSLITYCSQNPQLKKIIEQGDGDQRMSMVEAFRKAAEMGLPLGTHAYLVPFGGKVTMIPDYKGLLAIWRRDPDSHVTMPELVYSNDQFFRRKGVEGGRSANTLIHEPAIGDRGDVVGGYIIWCFHDHADYLYMDMQELNDLKLAQINKLPEGRRANSPWITHTTSMFLKTLVRRAAKWGSTDPNVQELLAKDDEANEVSEVYVRPNSSPVNAKAAEEEIIVAPAPAKKEPAPAKKAPVQESQGDSVDTPTPGAPLL